MIKIFSGTDTFESYKNAKLAVSNTQKENNLELQILYGDDVKNITEILNHLEGIGMFSESKVLFLKRLFDNKKLVQEFVENFDSLDKYELIIWEDSKLDSKLKLVKLLKTKSRITNYDLPKQWDLEKWILQYANSKKIKLSSKHSKYILERTENNKWLIHNEIKKIESYLDLHKKNTITDTELEAIMGMDVKGDIWKFLDYFGNRDKKNVTKEFNKIYQFENNIQYLIAMLARELNLLVKVKEAQKTDGNYKALGLHPFVLQKTINKARNFSEKDLENLYFNLIMLDSDVKSGKIKERIGFINFLRQI